ncbi:recombinase RecT [Mycolicibacterium mucogenicum]|uniref:recombinase RecT n=1 Tax=Mycolicibacterium mucogenicum TaxID=56689 RepID=UPI00076AB259|nr:recombinase RecT [Mycolicibacterium mucogenicum]
MTTTTKTAEAGPRIGPDPTAGGSSLAIRPGQTSWNEAQERAIRRQVSLEHADQADLDLYFHYALRTGLDPFTRQVYMVGRDTKVKVRVTNPDTGNERIEERRVTKFTIQVGIDGWRVLGNRAAKRDGVRVGHKQPLYAGKDGVWTSVWTHAEPPLACEYTLIADGVEITSVLYYAEYVQLVLVDGQYVPNSMWKKSPLNQIAKCAEALCWRKAFPADFAGLILEDAAQHDVFDGQIIDESGNTVVAPSNAASAPRQQSRKASGAARNAQRAARAQQATVVDAEPGPPPPMSEEKRTNYVSAVHKFLAHGQVTDDSDQRRVVAELGGLDVLPDAIDAIDDATLHTVANKLADLDYAARRTKNPTKAMTEALTEVLDAWGGGGA